MLVLGIPLSTILYYAAMALAVAIAIVFAAIACCASGRRLIHRYWCIFRITLGVEVGVKGLLWLVVVAACASFFTAYGYGAIKGSNAPFAWRPFLRTWAAFTVFGVLVKILDGAVGAKKILGPAAGSMLRQDRKGETAAVLNRISSLIRKRHVDVDVARGVLTDILDIIVSHVRDHRCLAKPIQSEVFANILVDAGSQLTVVARDKVKHDVTYPRPCPISYPRSDMLCERAMATSQALSIGLLSEKIGKGVKPYESILAIPLCWFDDPKRRKPYGALSIDCSRPYFFEGFRPNQTEADFENSLLPYCALITMVLEHLVSRDRDEAVAILATEGKVAGANE